MRPIPSRLPNEGCRCIRASDDRAVPAAGRPVAAARLCLLLAFLIVPSAVLAQNANPRIAQGSENQADWAAFERYNPENLRRFVHSTSVSSNWINETDSLWYVWEDRHGKRFNLVNPRGPSKQPLFDHQLMADLLSQELGRYLEAHDLPIQDLEFNEDGRRIEFRVGDTRFEFDLSTRRLVNLGEIDDDDDDRTWRRFSPDSTAYVYAEDHNLFYVEIVDGVEQDAVQLTDDGEEYYSFGSRDVDEDEQEEVRSRDRRVATNATWSEDSRAFYITRSDRRHLDKLYLVDVLADPRPTLEAYPYAMPGEDNIAQAELYVFRRSDRSLRQLEVDRWRTQDIMSFHWTNGGSDKLRLIRRARSRRVVELIEVDLATNAIHSLITESVERGQILHETPRYAGEDNSGDFLWYSRRTGWAHLYRYSHDGQLRDAVTRGPWNVRGIQEIDNGTVWFTAVGREPGENVNYQHLYRARLDGSQLTLLDPDNADHRSSISPSKRFVLNNASRVDLPPRSVLRDNQGRVVLELEALDVSELEAFGWRMAEPFVVKSADGVTDIYGNMWKPFDFDPEKRYPVIAHVYPGPQTESVTTGFNAASQQQHLAQLGFIVIQIGNRGGTPIRSAAYHSYGYFNLRDYGLADKKAGIEQLAKMHPFLDATRVGIYGHSGGGFMTAAALLVPPFNEFFTVGVSSAGNHDNNVYNNSWSERHHGLTVRCVAPEAELVADGETTGTNDGRSERASPARRRNDASEVPNELHCDNGQDVAFEIHIPANHEVAENLRGRLLLQHGDMDNNVHHVGTMRLVRELMRHNKRFDFMMMPGMRHGFGREYSPYWDLVRAEYFASHLLGDVYRSAEMFDRR